MPYARADGGVGAEDAAGRGAPEQLAVVAQAVDRAVVGADDEAPVQLGWGAFQGAARAVPPDHLVRGQAHGVEAAVLVAEEHPVTPHERRRLAAPDAGQPPLRLARQAVEDQKEPRQRGDVDGGRIDGRGRGEAGVVAYLVAPMMRPLLARRQMTRPCPCRRTGRRCRSPAGTRAGLRRVAPLDAIGRPQRDRWIEAGARQVIAVGRPVAQRWRRAARRSSPRTRQQRAHGKRCRLGAGSACPSNTENTAVPLPIMTAAITRSISSAFAPKPQNPKTPKPQI